jgi:5-methylcytosine-specific restriction endonuclease McrA
MPYRNSEKYRIWCQAYRDKNREYFRNQMKKWRAENPERAKEIRARGIQKRGEYYSNLRLEMIKAYGGKCATCGEMDTEVLEFDHVNNDGSIHRKEINAVGNQWYAWAKKNNYPSIFQVLCANCHRRKHRKRQVVIDRILD